MWASLQAKAGSLASHARQKLLDIISRLIDIELNTVPRNEKGEYDTQILKQGQVVYVNFIGAGSVINRHHYAIVWEAQPKADHVIVIPMTSQPYPRHDLGEIIGLKSKVNVVKINQPQSVTRKSIQLTIHRGNSVHVSPEQLCRLRELFRITLLKERTLSDILYNAIDAYLPLTVPDQVRQWLDRPGMYTLRRNGDHADFYYQATEGQGELSHLPLVKIKMSFSQRRKLLEGLLSEKETVRSASEQTLQTMVQAHSHVAVTKMKNT